MKTDHILYEEIHSALITQIHKGRYKTGDFLPSFSELCTEFNVSNITVRKAVHMLLEEGYVIPLKSKRFQVTFDIQNPDSAQEYLGQLIARKQAIASTFDALAVMVPALVVAGARHCGGEQLDELSKIIQAINPWTQPLSQIAESLSDYHSRMIGHLRNQAALEFCRQAVTFVTVSYMPAFDLPHPLGPQFINARNYMRRFEEMIRAGRFMELKARLRNSYRVSHDSVANYIDTVTLGAKAENPVPFTWLLMGSDPYPQVELVDELMRDIATGDLKPGQMLPPPPVLARRHGVSEFYVRKTLATLGSVGITETINGRGTRLLYEPFPIVSFQDNRMLRRLLRRMLDAMQLAAITSAEVIREAIRWEPGNLPPDLAWEGAFPAREMLAWIAGQIESDTLRGVYEQILHIMLFGYLVTHGHLHLDDPCNTRTECRAALERLRAGDREGFAVQVQEVYTEIHRSVRDWMLAQGVPEEELTRL